jgi:hypothetical protein
MHRKESKFEKRKASLFYLEKQEGMYCGAHSINALLGGPFVSKNYSDQQAMVDSGGTTSSNLTIVSIRNILKDLKKRG